jgi:hypothetical protein
VLIKERSGEHYSAQPNNGFSNELEFKGKIASACLSAVEYSQ